MTVGRADREWEPSDSGLAVLLNGRIESQAGSTTGGERLLALKGQVSIHSAIRLVDYTNIA